MADANNAAPDPLGAFTFIERQKQAHQAGVDAAQWIMAIPKLLAALALLVVSAVAAPGMLALRRRIGIATLMTHGFVGLFLLSQISIMSMMNPLSSAAAAWFAVGLVAFLIQLALRSQRLMRPVVSDHIHRWSMGEPALPLAWLWARILPRRWLTPGRVHVLIEPALLALVALLVFTLEDPLRSRESADMPGTHWPFLIVAIAMHLQASYLSMRGAWELHVMRDHELEQRNLAAKLAELPAPGESREAEGVAEVGVDGRVKP